MINYQHNYDHSDSQQVLGTQGAYTHLQQPHSSNQTLIDRTYDPTGYEANTIGIEFNPSTQGPLMQPEHMDIDHNDSMGALPAESALNTDKFEASPLP